MRRAGFCCLVDRQDGKKYPAKLNVVFKPVCLDQTTPAGDILQTAQLAPDQRIPDGNYIRLPYQFDTNEVQVSVVSGRMFAGWR